MLGGKIMFIGHDHCYENYTVSAHEIALVAQHPVLYNDIIPFVPWLLTLLVMLIFWWSAK